jgi:hypothetical protein
VPWSASSRRRARPVPPASAARRPGHRSGSTCRRGPHQRSPIRTAAHRPLDGFSVGGRGTDPEVAKRNLISNPAFIRDDARVPVLLLQSETDVFLMDPDRGREPCGRGAGPGSARSTRAIGMANSNRHCGREPAGASFRARNPGGSPSSTDPWNRFRIDATCFAISREIASTACPSRGQGLTPVGHVSEGRRGAHPAAGWRLSNLPWGLDFSTLAATIWSPRSQVWRTTPDSGRSW